MKRRKKNDGSALVIAMIFVTVLTMLTASYLDSVSSGTIGTAFIDRASQAYYAAVAGAHVVLYQINNGGASTASGSLTPSTYTANYSSSYDSGTSVITSTGTVASGSETTSTRTVSVRVKPIPPYVRAAISASGDVTIKNNAISDGRDYDTSGTLTGGAGTYGVSATGDLTQLNSSTVGGNGNAPANPAASSAYQQRASAFASTQPWDILGVSQAWFDANVTNTTTAPTAPWSGIVYYTPTGGDWDGGSIDGSTGILIIHNSTNTARIKNMTGTFKGLIIADKFREESGNTATIIGGVVVTNTVQSNGGNMTIKYSRATLTNLQSLISNQTSNWKKILQDSSWSESAS